MTPPLRLVFWETTKACNLTCRHCRAVPQRAIGPMELTTRRALDLIDDIAIVAKPVMVLSGGEPLFRPDLFEIAAYGVESGFRMALATNGTLVTGQVAAKIADAGFSRVAISLDGANPATHDRCRGLPGSHALALRGLRNLRAALLPHPRAADRGGAASGRLDVVVHRARHEGEGGARLHDARGRRASARPRPAPVGDDARLPRGNERLLHLERRHGLSVRLPAGDCRRYARAGLR